MDWHSSMDLPPLEAEDMGPDPGSGMGSSAIFPFDLCGRGGLSIPHKVVFRVNGRIRQFKKPMGWAYYYYLLLSLSLSLK